jgi:hypothetical protein
VIARITFSPTMAYGDGAMPARIDSTRARPFASRRVAAAVRTGKLETPDKAKTWAARAGASRSFTPSTKSAPSARSR